MNDLSEIRFPSSYSIVVNKSRQPAGVRMHFTVVFQELELGFDNPVYLPRRLFVCSHICHTFITFGPIQSSIEH